MTGIEPPQPLVQKLLITCSTVTIAQAEVTGIEPSPPLVHKLIITCSVVTLAQGKVTGIEPQKTRFIILITNPRPKDLGV